MVTVNFHERGISLESKQRVIHRPTEKVIYTCSFPSSWSAAITGTPTILKAVDVLIPGTDLKSTLFPSGAASSTSTTVVLPLMQDLTFDITYRVHINFTDGTNTFEATFLVECRN